jgi:dihydrofolate reductase
MRRVVVDEWMSLDGVAETVRALQKQSGGDLHVMGGTRLVHTLIDN